MKKLLFFLMCFLIFDSFCQRQNVNRRRTQEEVQPSRRVNIRTARTAQNQELKPTVTITRRTGAVQQSITPPPRSC